MAPTQRTGSPNLNGSGAAACRRGTHYYRTYQSFDVAMWSLMHWQCHMHKTLASVMLSMCKSLTSFRKNTKHSFKKINVKVVHNVVHKCHS